MTKKRFNVSVQEIVIHSVDVVIDDSDGDAAAGYVTGELLDSVRRAMREEGHTYYLDKHDIHYIDYVQEEEEEEDD